MHPENETPPHVIKDFISLLQRNIRNKIANKWAEMRNPPRTIQEAFNLADRTKSQIHVADSFKLELYSDFIPAEVNEVSAEEISGDESEVNEVIRNGKQGYNNNYKKVIMVTIKITAVNPVTTVGLKKISWVKSGNKKKMILKSY